MNCFEIRLNDGEPLVVGSPEGLFAGTLMLLPSGGAALRFTAQEFAGPDESETKAWQVALPQAAELRIRVVESQEVSPPTSQLEHGAAKTSSLALQGCSICRRGSSEVARLIAAGPVSICDECVALCNEALGNVSPGEA